MSWLVHRWLLLYGIALFVIKDCQGLFLRHTQSGKCITRSENLVYNNPNHALPYFVVMTDNCLDVKAQFRYLDNELLHNIEKNGTLISPDQPTNYRRRWAVYKGISIDAKNSQKSPDNRLKQTDAESLSLYNINVCAEPSTTYVMRRTYCDRPNQKFTFGAVTNYGTKMENAHCSPKQHMVVKSANYGDFTKNGVFNDVKNTATKCNALTNCQVKYLCGGNRSCELNIDSKLLSSPDCSDTSKQIYIKYACVDSNSSTIITTAPNIRLSRSPNRGYVQIKDGSTWRYVKEENWDLSREKTLCQHLGFHETDAHSVSNGRSGVRTEIATGDLMCYKEQPSGTSCCVHLEPSTTTRAVRLPIARCKICDRDNPILHNSNAIFSGSGSENYDRAQFYNIYGTGWCASGSTPYLTLDLLKEYHITRIVTMGNKDQTKWIESYSVKYSHDETLVDDSTEMQITGNRNGYQASTTNVNIYNVRHIKIQSTGGSSNFCLRIELCGEVQTPSPVSYINVTPSDTSAQVTMGNPPAPQTSSYIKSYDIYLGQEYKRTVDRQKSMFTIGGLEPNTKYTVTIYARDGSLQRSNARSKEFMTSEAAPSSPPSGVYFTQRSKNQLTISWRAPPTRSLNGKLAGYQVCYSDEAKSSDPRRFPKDAQSFTAVITNLQHSTKYFVTVAAYTGAGYGPKSEEISKITNGDSMNPVQASYSSLSLSITKPAQYIRTVMVIVQVGTKDRRKVEDINTYELEPYQANRQDPYVTAYLKADVLPLTFEIGDGKEYNSTYERYFNQPLKQNSSYMVFLRFFESQNWYHYYSTGWSNIVKTFAKPSGKMCDNSLLGDANTFPNSIFSGSGDSNNTYKEARITGKGWCPTGSGTTYLLLDLQKEYHITRVVVMADREHTKWSDSYSMTYSHDKSYKNSEQIKGNKNGYETTITSLDIYNVRYVKIKSTLNINYCLRIELCGEVQTPAPAYNIKVYPSKNSARVTWSIQRATQDSSYITQIIIYLNNKKYKTIFRGTEVNITGLIKDTTYTVKIKTQDGSSQKSQIVNSSSFTTNEAEPLATSYYTMSMNIPQQQDYIREAMVIVQNAKSSSTPSENLRTSDLKPYKTNIKDPYITAYLKADVLPLTFVIGDGKEYSSEKEKYFNQPLKQHSNYIVFLRYFENQWNVKIQNNPTARKSVWLS